VIRAWPAAAVAEAERPLLDAGVDLMAVASTALATRCLAELRRIRGRVTGADVVLLVGSGNNGGDALHAGALLRRRGAAVTALLTADRAHDGGLAALRAAGGRVRPLSGPGAVPVDQARRLLSGADLVLDGILGIGATGAVRGPVHDVLDGELDRPGAVVAVDLPSGVDPGTGAVHGPVLAADVTVTFGAAKPGLLLPPGDILAGDVQVVPLGLDLAGAGDPAVVRWQGEDLAGAWPWPWRSADKYARGVLGIVAGGPQFPGAAILAARGAVCSGAGMIRLAGDHEVGRAVVASCPEAVPDPLPDTGRVQAWLVGPGMDPENDRTAARLVEAVAEKLRRDETVVAVVDAGAVARLGLLAATGALRRPGRLLLTPHAGELAGLLTAVGDRVDRRGVQQDPAAHARRAAAVTGGTVLLKGATTVVASPDGPIATVAAGPAWLATAGSGDVLSGVAGTLLAAGLPPGTAGPAAALVHGLSGRTAAGPGRGGPVPAGAVAAAIRPTLAGL
jgi:hydroxyethylthiazole kinase-like uncharacterized protein yjeF